MDQGALGVELTGMFCSAANLSRSARPLCAGQLGRGHKREGVELAHAKRL